MNRAGICLLLALAVRLAPAQDYQYPVYEFDKTPVAELRARRDKVKEDLGHGAVGVFFTNPVRNRNNDIDFDFRADSSYLYLTGFEEPDSALILVPDGVELDGKRTTEILFVNAPNQQSITWLGYRMGTYYAPRVLGIETAYTNDKFSTILKQVLASKPKLTIGPIPEGPVGTLQKMIDATNRMKTELALESGPSVAGKIRVMRGVKSPYEQTIMKKVCDLSARAHVEVMKAIRPGMREWEVSALMQYHFAKEGCEYTGYPPICGTGPNSTILHYESNRRQMQSGDMICLDSAGEYHGYSADVTRSYPVNGKFTPEQRAIYQVVYDAQELGISMCRTGNSFQDIGQAISAKLADGLTKLGIISKPTELHQYYMHGFGHGLGLDVHDPAPRVLAPGVCLTVEPGIYIKEGSPCDKKWWNIGIRIEDDILVTDKDPVNMSAAAPRKLEDIEKLMTPPAPAKPTPAKNSAKKHRRGR